MAEGHVLFINDVLSNRAFHHIALTHIWTVVMHNVVHIYCPFFQHICHAYKNKISFDLTDIAVINDTTYYILSVIFSLCK